MDQLDIVLLQIAEDTESTVHVASFGTSVDRLVVDDDIWEVLLRAIEIAPCFKRKDGCAFRWISSDAASAELLG